MQIPFGEWLPDQPEHGKNGANVANNVYHAANTYKRFPSLVSYSSNTTSTDSKGAGSFRDNSNTVYNFVATRTNIYQLTSGAFTSRKASLTGDHDDFWQWCGHWASNLSEKSNFYFDSKRARTFRAPAKHPRCWTK